MVVGVVGDVACTVGLLDSADPVGQSLRAGHGPRSSECLGVTQERKELTIVPVGLGREAGFDRWQRGDVGDAPGLLTVRQVPVGEQQHGSPVRDGDAGCLERRVETVCGGLWRDHGDGGLPVAPVQRLQQISLFGLRRQAGRRTAALHVHHQQWQFERDGQTDRLALEREARPGGRGHPQRAAVGRPESCADAGDLVLGLEGRDVVPLVPAQLVQDVACRGDRVGPEEQR